MTTGADDAMARKSKPLTQDEQVEVLSLMDELYDAEGQPLADADPAKLARLNALVERQGQDDPLSDGSAADALSALKAVESEPPAAPAAPAGLPRPYRAGEPVPDGCIVKVLTVQGQQRQYLYPKANKPQ
jgi:hypothetical protein